MHSIYLTLFIGVVCQGHYKPVYNLFKFYRMKFKLLFCIGISNF